ncbi:putative 6-phosphogluconolactonase [Hyphodiscus hymeniophilus]|uniref:6-phosphogluconolactonase n=1 Tax=Hyphodiscus hymeniophilus TaxID=353542 RepID=A0A9P6VR24_9HELO|nr:putative 6-phosphogluconolactonase [Hyphodiscus hymeniophilus]
MWLSFSEYFGTLPATLRSYTSMLPLSHGVKMRLLDLLPLGSLMTSSLATKLCVSSYAGTITSLQLDQETNGKFTLNQTAVNTGSQPNPAWLTKDPFKDVLYCVDEGLAVPNGTLASYKTSASGELTQIDHHSVISGPVSSVVYNGGAALALAHYGGSAVTTWTILPSGGVSELQTFSYTLSAPGPNPIRQDCPHPHEALVDPTDSYVVVPDLGADLVRIFSIDPETSLLTESTPLATPAGSGPRHGAFLKTEGDTFFFLVSELANTIVSYKVSYGEKEMAFSPVFESGIYGPKPTPEGAALAEVLLSPDNRYLLTCSRNATLFSIPNFDPLNATKIPSDTLQVWKIDHETGGLTFEQLAPSGGRYPRQFSVNHDGTLAAVGLQLDGRVVIVERDVESGMFGRFVAAIDIPGQITSVIWDE